MNRKNIKYTVTNKFDDTIKPIVTAAIWGKIKISHNGVEQIYRDAIIYPSGHESWDWNISNTHHVPGVQILEIKKLVDAGCRSIILSTGFENVLQVGPETIAYMKENNIPYTILNSMDAIGRYNESSDNNVGFLLHSTC